MGIVYARERLQPEHVTHSDWKPLDKVAARVDKVHFDGIRRTKEDVLLHVVSYLLHADNFQDVVLRAHGVRQQLESLNAFSKVEIILDTSSGPDATPDGLEVTFDVKEKSRITGNISALVGDNEGSLLFKFLFPNIFGRGEAVQTEYQYGKKTVGLNVTATKPIFSWVEPRINQIVFGQTSEFPWSGYREKSKGLAAEIVFESSPQVLHTLRWEGVWRNVRCLSSSTPFEVREEAGHSVKSSVKHILTMDQRDDPCLPFRGCYFRLYQEYAGLGGNVSFLKHEMQYQANKAIFGDFVLQATLLGGLVKTLGSNSSVRINDRFFLGGPLSLRGFLMHGAGPHVQEASLGAEAYWAGALHAYAPLPFRPLRHILDKICRIHLFVNTGNIGNFAFTDDYHHNAVLLLSRLRWSCGCGLVLAVGGVARFELNYCLPLAQEPGDRTVRGLQMGIGMNFL